MRSRNLARILSLLATNGILAQDSGIAKVDVATLNSSLQSALSSSDLVVTTGGVSMGDRDLLRQVLVDKFGAEIQFARVNMKPGKPTTFATCQLDGRTRVIIGLPGNPVSASVTCHLYVLPAGFYISNCLQS